MSRREQLLDNLVADLEPVAPVSDPRLLAGIWLLVSAAYVVGVTHLLGPIRPNALAQLQENPRFALEMGLGVLTAVGIGLMAFRSAVPGGLSRLLAVLTGVFGAVWIGGLLVGLVHPALEPSMLGKRDHCYIETLIYALPPMLALLYWQRRLFPLKPGHSALLAGLAAGVLPALYMQIACMHDPAHILLFHIAPGLAAGPVALLLWVVYRRLRLSRG